MVRAAGEGAAPGAPAPLPVPWLRRRAAALGAVPAAAASSARPAAASCPPRPAGAAPAPAPARAFRARCRRAPVCRVLRVFSGMRSERALLAAPLALRGQRCRRAGRGERVERAGERGAVPARGRSGRVENTRRKHRRQAVSTAWCPNSDLLHSTWLRSCLSTEKISCRKALLEFRAQGSVQFVPHDKPTGSAPMITSDYSLANSEKKPPAQLGIQKHFFAENR